MPKLPIVSGTEAVKAMQLLGFFVDRQRGSHVVLKKSRRKASVVVSSPWTDGFRETSSGVATRRGPRH